MRRDMLSPQMLDYDDSVDKHLAAHLCLPTVTVPISFPIQCNSCMHAYLAPTSPRSPSIPSPGTETS
jgi:hypothetical protein